MKKLLLVSMATLSLSSYAKCTKADAKKAVEFACKTIVEKGAAAKNVIKKYRYCGDDKNYVWLQDKDVKMVMHPYKPRLNGKSLLKTPDKKGMLLFVEFDKVAKSTKEGGWVEYYWKKPSAEEATPKVSFIKKCDDKTGWIAGSGIWK